MKKTKTLKSILSFAVAAAMTASLAVLPVHAADSTFIEANNAEKWTNSGWNSIYNETEKDVYTTKNDDNGVDVHAKAGTNVGWGSGKAAVVGGKRNASLTGSTKLFDFEVEIPDDETFALNSTYLALSTHTSTQNYVNNISVGLRIKDNKYQLYVKLYTHVNTYEYFVIDEADSFNAIKGWHNVKFALDIQSFVLAVYDKNGDVTCRTKLDEISNSGLCFSADTFLDYAAVFLNNSADTENEKVISYRNFNVKSLDRTLDATFTREGDVVKATFSEAISQSALNNASYSVAINGETVSGATVTATKTGEKTADLTVSGITSGAAFALSVDNVFANSGRTSNGAMQYSAPGQKIYNDSIVIDGNDASKWKNSYNNTLTSENDLYATATSNGEIEVTAKAGLTPGWGSGKVLIPGGNRKTDIQGKTALFNFDVKIPDDEAFALETSYWSLSMNKGDQDINNQVVVILRKNNDKYQLCTRLFREVNTFDYFVIDEADSFEEIKGWHNVKFAVDTEKFELVTYNEDGSVSYSRKLDTITNAGLAWYSNSKIDYAAIMPTNSSDTAKTILYKNIYVKTLERGLEATFTREGDVVKATFSEEISQSVLNNASYSVAINGETVSGATVTATKTGEKTADLTVSGITSGAAFALSVDNVFANSGRTSNGAMQYSAPGQKIYNDTVIVGNATSNNWGNVVADSTNANDYNAYVTDNTDGGFDINIKANTTASWSGGTTAAPVLNGSTYKKFFNAGKTLMFDFDVQIPEDETFALNTTYLALRRKTPEYNVTQVLLKKNATTSKYELYVDNWFDNGRNGKYVIATADTFADMAGWHHVKFSMDTQKSLLVVYAEDGTVSYSTPINVGNNDLVWTDDVELRAIVIYPGGNNSTDQKISYKNFNIKQLERGLEATATTNAKSTQFTTTVEFEESVNIADIQKFVTVARKDGQTDTVAPQVTVTADGASKAVITVTKLFADTQYSLKLDGLFDNNGRTSNGALINEVIKTTKSDSVYIDGTPTVSATASGLNASVTYKNASDEKQSFWTAVALYKSNGEIVALVPMDITDLASGSDVTKTFTAETDCSEAVTAKVFVWDSLETMNALQKCELISLK